MKGHRFKTRDIRSVYDIAGKPPRLIHATFPANLEALRYITLALRNCLGIFLKLLHVQCIIAHVVVSPLISSFDHHQNDQISHCGPVSTPL